MEPDQPGAGGSCRFLPILDPSRPAPCLRQRGPCGKNRPPAGAFWGRFLEYRACCRSSVVEHSIGNGEVDSSILSGSTSLSLAPPHKISISARFRLIVSFGC